MSKTLWNYVQLPLNTTGQFGLSSDVHAIGFKGLNNKIRNCDNSSSYCWTQTVQ